MRKYQYYNTNDDNDRDGYGVNWMGQTFTPVTDHIIGKVKLKLFRVGDPGTITVSIKATSGGEPVGADLCFGTIEGMDLTDNANGEFYEISFGDGFDLDIGAQYAIVVKAPSGDASNKVSWRADITTPTYTGGLYCASSDSGVDWDTYSGVDCMFEEWGVGPASPTTITWGNLFKSQISAEKIEEAILRFIQLHEDDPDAHIETGESLQSHKASIVIDHVVDSIIADKLADWIEIKIKGSFDRSDYHWWSVFESLDGFWLTQGGTGATSQEKSYVKMTTGGDNGSWALVQKWLDIMNVFTWDKRRRFRTRVYFHNNTNQGVVIGMGSRASVPDEEYVAFLVENGTVYGVTSDGATETKLDLSFAITDEVAYNLEAKFSPGEKAEFYIDGVLKGTIETNLPAGTEEANCLAHFYIGNAEAVEKYITFSYFDFWQEI